MAGMTFQQIEDRLNEVFALEGRQLVFWYDEHGEFAEEVDSLQLTNASVLHLTPDTQFKTKLLLEREDPIGNYLIYAPFPKPDIRENHLADTLRYSLEFLADRASVLVNEFGMDERLKPVLQRYIRFFANKTRVQAFKALEIDNWSRSTIETGIMCVLCRVPVCSFEEVVRAILSDGSLDDHPMLAEFGKYDLLEPFWKQCESVFGYTDSEPDLTRLLMTMFVTYMGHCTEASLPKSWTPFVSFKRGTIIAFLDSMMNSVKTSERFDELSLIADQVLNAGDQLKSLPLDALTNCCLFARVDEMILHWMKDRLLDENVDAKLGDKNIAELCDARQRMHFGTRYDDEYALMIHAREIIRPGKRRTTGEIAAITRAYLDEDWKIDRHYRLFYRHYDALEDNRHLEDLRILVERIYTNDYLDPLLVSFSTALSEAKGDTGLPRQAAFYAANIRNARDRVAVIISDAMRYEVGQSLFERLQADEKCTATISAMQSMLPSVTRAGMAALLPQRQLTIQDADSVLADGLPTIDLPQREQLLVREKPKSRAVQADALFTMSVDELREIFAGQDVVYIYHNQIDARGDKYNTENEVFIACEEAVAEIVRLIRRLTISANTSHFIVTSDHGFLYKRDKLTGGSKIGGISGASDRFVLTDSPLQMDGVCSFPLQAFASVPDNRWVNCPIGSDLFRAPGAGKNYVHGGCSPQEILIPVIDVKTEKAKRETTSAGIQLVTLLSKVTNLSSRLDFFQKEPVSDVVKAATYRIRFEDDQGEKISNEVLFKADSTIPEDSRRIFPTSFTFKNRRYDRTHRYYLIVTDEKTGMETERREVIMDLAFADDFGF